MSFSDSHRMTVCSFPNRQKKFDVVVVVDGKPISVIKDVSGEQKRSIYETCEEIAGMYISEVTKFESQCRQSFDIVKGGKKSNVNHDPYLVSDR